MPAGVRTLAVEPLSCADIVAVVQCIALDAGAFPYASAQFGLRSASARIWVAREPGHPRVLGFVAGRGRHGLLRIDGLAVDGRERRRGIGRALVCAAVAGARADGMRAVTLHVSVANQAAIALYRAQGFVIERLLTDFYPAEAFEGQGDAHEMTLVLRTSASGIV
jgi:ribosomal protein S18 acetylase RimI-like enzyme